MFLLMQRRRKKKAAAVEETEGQPPAPPQDPITTIESNDQLDSDNTTRTTTHSSSFFHFTRQNRAETSKLLDISPDQLEHVRYPTFLSPISLTNYVQQVESRGVSRKYFLRRPRALQYRYRRRVIAVNEDAHEPLPESFGKSESSDQNEHHEETHDHQDQHPLHRHHHHHEPVSIRERRERLDLFIDLIWVGIISNLSEVYSEWYFTTESGHVGEAVAVFYLAFLPSWRIWNVLREFMNDYYMDDFAQRIFIFWILVLSVFFGNNLAYLKEDGPTAKVICVLTYSTIRFSFMLMELVYSIYIPWLRKLIILQFLLKLPAVALWIAVIFTPGWSAAGVAAAATWCEYFVPLVFDSPWADRLVHTDYLKAVDQHHFTSRMGNFFIIVVGEGVLQLIKDGPLGQGLNYATSVSWAALTIYFLLTFFYFGRDNSKYYIPAVKRHGWWNLLWIFFHIPMFSSFLTLVAGIMFIIRQAPQALINQHIERFHGEELAILTQDAIWTISISLCVALSSMTGLQLCDKPLDPPGTLKINNRYVRLAPRIPFLAITLCLPLVQDFQHNPFTMVGVLALLTISLMIWETSASMEAGGGLLEPRGLTVMMHHELVGKATNLVSNTSESSESKGSPSEARSPDVDVSHDESRPGS